MKRKRLDNDTVNAIRNDIMEGKRGKEIAEKYGIGESTVSNIRSNRCYRDSNQQNELDNANDYENYIITEEQYNVIKLMCKYLGITQKDIAYIITGNTSKQSTISRYDKEIRTNKLYYIELRLIVEKYIRTGRVVPSKILIDYYNLFYADKEENITNELREHVDLYMKYHLVDTVKSSLRCLSEQEEVCLDDIKNLYNNLRNKQLKDSHKRPHLLIEYLQIKMVERLWVFGRETSTKGA